MLDSPLERGVAFTCRALHSTAADESNLNAAHLYYPLHFTGHSVQCERNTRKAHIGLWKGS